MHVVRRQKKCHALKIELQVENQISIYICTQFVQMSVSLYYLNLYNRLNLNVDCIVLFNVLSMEIKWQTLKPETDQPEFVLYYL